MSKKMHLILITIVLSMGLLFTIICVLLILSPGHIEPYLDNTYKPLAGSISEKTFIKIGGITIKIIIPPILLF
jgi:hypothetical protein